MSLVSVVTPVYNEIDNIRPFVDRMNTTLGESGIDWEFVFVADPCTDGTIELIQELGAVDPRIKLVELTRRFGQPTATLAGLDFAEGDAVIVMDVDLQDPPSAAAQMIRKWQHGALLVLGQRTTRTGEPLLKKAVARSGYAFLSRFAEVPIPQNTGDFRLMDRSVVQKIQLFPEAHGFLRGLVSLVGYEPEVVYFDRPERFGGHTKYNKWIGSLKIGFNGVVGFSTALLNVATMLGLVSAVLAVITAIAYLSATLAGFPFPIGNPTIVILMLLLGGLILVSLGILGLYVGRIYDEVKRRPRYLVKATMNIGPR